MKSRSAAVLVILAAIALRAPLARVPENTLKFAVGVLLSAFGVFWIGEGLRFTWLGEDLALVALIVAFLIVAFLIVAFLIVARVALIAARSVARSSSTPRRSSGPSVPFPTG